jgi:LacI family transcriptional regulator
MPDNRDFWAFFTQKRPQEALLDEKQKKVKIYTMKINIYDVAKKAGVSIATVSRVLNNKTNVSTATRQQVLKVLNGMNYRPSPIARGMVSSFTHTVGIMTIDIRSPHYAESAFAMERELFKLNYSSILCNTGGGLENNVRYLHMLVDKGANGIICIGSVFRNTFEDTSVLAKFSHIPIVFSNCVINANNVHCIVVDEIYGARLCVEHLHKKGYKHILYVKDAVSHSASEKERGFLESMWNFALPVDETSVFVTNRGLEGGMKAVDDIIASGKKFSAIIFGDDHTAVGGLNRLKKLGYRIPRDVAIIGYNKTIPSLCCDPRLTTVDYKTDLMGSLTVKMLETVMMRNETSRLLTVTPELVIREST